MEASNASDGSQGSSTNVSITNKSFEDDGIIYTPTGKVSKAKTRVYTQRYRKEWECMTDFKDWLTSVPNEATKAWCKYCERSLHAHRLSLLKHMCTLKHQKAAKKRERDTEKEDLQEVELVMKKVESKQQVLEDDEEMIEDINYEQLEEQSDEEVNQDISMIDMDEIDVKPIQIENQTVEEDGTQNVSIDLSADENVNSSELQVVLGETEDEDGVKTYQVIKCPDVASLQQQILANKIIITKLDANGQATLATCDDDSEILSESQTLTEVQTPPAPKKVLYMAPSLARMDRTKQIKKINTIKSDPAILRSSRLDNKKVNLVSIDKSKTKPIVILNTMSSVKNILIKKQPTISTRVIDGCDGLPCIGLQVSLYKLFNGRWTFISESVTNSNGTCQDLSQSSKSSISAGRYKLHYDVEKYYSTKKRATAFPFVEIPFDVKDPQGIYDSKITLTPFTFICHREQ
ncbi:hypothetical protein TKK_0001122 [Trichogramma kaykai]|uniref:Transthyretin/hydroxyisourate hydrolase domain-containing protein n=1 Tax=Trichogramma kaykai TaxID=54128 RepID=A0ABD2WST2_9HYME